MATSDERKQFANAVKSILYHCDQLGSLPDDLSASFGAQDVGAAVAAIKHVYSPGFRPALIQALVALQAQEGYEEPTGELVNLLTPDEHTRAALKTAPDASAFRTGLRG